MFDKIKPAKVALKGLTKVKKKGENNAKIF